AWPNVTQSHPDRSVDVDIELTRSTDGGVTWLDPRSVNDVRRWDRFFPSISVLGNGTIGIAFYDRRFDSSQLSVYAARASFQGGFHVSPSVRINAGPSPISSIYYVKPTTCYSPGRFFGDYLGTSAGRGNTFCIVWADTQDA